MVKCWRYFVYLVTASRATTPIRQMRVLLNVVQRVAAHQIIRFVHTVAKDGLKLVLLVLVCTLYFSPSLLANVPWESQWEVVYRVCNCQRSTIVTGSLWKYGIARIVSSSLKTQRSHFVGGGVRHLFSSLHRMIIIIIIITTHNHCKHARRLQQFLYYFQMLILFFGPESGWISWLSALNFNALASGGPACVIPLSPLQQLLTGLVCFHHPLSDDGHVTLFC